MDASLVDAGINMVMGVAGGITARANIQATNTVNEANAFATNLVRASSNELASKRGSLARYTQSVNNQRVLSNTGEQFAAAQVNYLRARDSATKDSFEGQVRFSEQAGAQAAAAAVSGLRGGVADVVAATTTLRKSRIQQAAADTLNMLDKDAQQRTRATLIAGWDSLDSSEITDAIAYGTAVATKQTYGGNLFTDMYGKQSGQNINAQAKFVDWLATPSTK